MLKFLQQMFKLRGTTEIFYLDFFGRKKLNVSFNALYLAGILNESTDWLRNPEGGGQEPLSNWMWTLQNGQAALELLWAEQNRDPLR